LSTASDTAVVNFSQIVLMCTLFYSIIFAQYVLMKWYTCLQLTPLFDCTNFSCIFPFISLI
jgi:hypothetical protein